MKIILIFFLISITTHASQFQCGEYELKGQLKVYPQGTKIEINPGTRIHSTIDVKELGAIEREVYKDKYISLKVKMNYASQAISLRSPKIIPQHETIQSKPLLIKSLPCE